MKSLSLLCICIGLSCTTLKATTYVENQVLVLDADVCTMSVVNAGSISSTQVVTMACPPAGGHNEIWFSTAGYPDPGSSVACPGACSASIFQDVSGITLGKISYRYKRKNSGGTTLTTSSKLFLASVDATPISSSFSQPLPVFGFTDATAPGEQFSVGNISTSGLRIYMYEFNGRMDHFSAFVNSGPEHVAHTTQVVGLTSNGSGTCTITTVGAHNIVSGTTVQLNFIHDTNDVSNGNPLKLDSHMNDFFTFTSTGTTTGTVPCNLGSGDWNTGLGIVGKNNGKTISATTFCAGEERYFGCLSSDHYPLQITFPLTSTEIVANATNTLYLRFKGDNDASTNGLFHGFYCLLCTVIEPDVEMDQIVVSGSGVTATVHTTSSHGYSTNDTILIRDAPGPRWRFNGLQTITVTDSTHFTFSVGSNVENGTAGVAPFLTSDGTYTVPTTLDDTSAHQPHMYAARSLIPKSSFTTYSVTSPSVGGGTAGNGATAFSAALKEPNSYFPTTQSKCSHCHDSLGRDLIYFGFTDQIIYTAAVHRGLTDTQARDIIAWLRGQSVTTPALGRPWNPPNQFGVGLDSAAIYDWSAGAGLQWVLTYDEDAKEYANLANWTTTGNINPREVPIFQPLPHWHQWLPTVDPFDFYTNYGLSGGDFSTDALWTNYNTFKGNQSTPRTLTSGINNTTDPITLSLSGNFTCATNDFVEVGFDSTRELMKVTAGCGTSSLTATRAQKGTVKVANSTGAHVINYSGYAGATYFVELPNLHNSAMVTFGTAKQNPWPSQTLMAQGPSKWVMVKMWELVNTFELYNLVDIGANDIFGAVDARAAAQPKRGWVSDGNSLFYEWPHITVSGDNFNNYYLNQGPRPSTLGTNWSIETNRGYLLALGVNFPSRRFYFGNPTDINYYNSFIHNGASNLRPASYMNMLATVYNLQGSLGWAGIFNSGFGAAFVSLFRQENWMAFQYVDLFTPLADKKALISQEATMLSQLVALFSTGTWQTDLPNAGLNCPLSQVANPALARGASSGNCYQDSVAWFLENAGWAGVSSTLTTPIVNWANAVWTSSGVDFSVYLSKACSYVSNPASTGATVPQYLYCAP